jgi:hypothetical protein
LGAAALGLMLLPGAALAAYQLNLSPPVSHAGLVAYELHNFMTLICLVIQGIQGRHISRKHRRRDCLDRRPVCRAGDHGRPRDQCVAGTARHD